jgi:gas vesicle protein
LGRAERKAKKAARRKRRGGFIFGMITGVAAGLMLAPKSGKETREQLLGEGGLSKQVERLKGAVGAGKESAAGQSESLKRKIEETRERLRQQAGDTSEGAPAAEAAAGEAPAE